MKAFLTQPEREALIKEHRKKRDRKRGDRIKVVLWSDEGVTQQEIARRLFISIDAVHDYLAAYQNDSKRLVPNHKGAQPLLTAEESKKLSKHLEEQVYQKRRIPKSISGKHFRSTWHYQPFCSGLEPMSLAIKTCTQAEKCGYRQAKRVRRALSPAYE